MSDFTVSITPSARKDIEDILRYIRDELRNPDAANTLLGRLKEAILSLSSMPFRHHIVADMTIASMNIRKILVENYIVFYTVYEETASVDIIRVLYAKRNWMNLL